MSEKQFMDILQKFKLLPLEHKSESFARVYAPLMKIEMPKLESRGDRPLQMSFEDQMKIMLYFHIQGCESGRELLQYLQEDAFARTLIRPKADIKKSSFFEAINHRGLPEMNQVLSQVMRQKGSGLPSEYSELGDLVAVDGTLIEATLSMHWADYRHKVNKAKMHTSFAINHGLPQRIVLTDGKADEKDFVETLVDRGQTAVLDRYYHCHRNFDTWQAQNLHFVCRIKANTNKTTISLNPLVPNSIVFYDAKVLLGTRYVNQTEKPVRLIGYRIGASIFWIATDRFDLTAEQIALSYKLRWDIESFFAWWKEHLAVYPVIARSHYGFALQLLCGIITYILLVLYCLQSSGRAISLELLRRLRIHMLHDFYFSLFSFIIKELSLPPEILNFLLLVFLQLCPAKT